MKAYSVDLRQKIVETYENEPISQRELAKRFRVALSFVVKLLKQYRSTGNLAPKPFNGGVKLKLTPEQITILADLIEQNNDATLQELRQLLKDKIGVHVSITTIFRMSQRLKITVKKNSVSL